MAHRQRRKTRRAKPRAIIPTIHSDPMLVSAVCTAFGWTPTHDALFTMIRPADVPQMTLIFAADCEIDVKFGPNTERGFVLHWTASRFPATLPSDARLAAIGHALQMFFTKIDLIEPDPGTPQ